MTIKEKADALVEKHIKYTSGWTSTNKPLEPATAQYEGVKMKLGRAIQCAILSVEHTIEVLEQTNSIIDEIGRPLEIQLMIEQEQLLLTELKSRL